jgi:hypothetical protein
MQDAGDGLRAGGQRGATHKQCTDLFA